MFISNIVN